MSRTRIELESKNNEQLSQIIDNILRSHGYEYTLYKGSDEKVWNQGIGLVKAPKYIKYYFENNKLILEGWIGTYGKETDLKGVIGALPKKDVKKVLNEIEENVNSFNLNSPNNITKSVPEDKPSNNTNLTNTKPTMNNTNNINQEQNNTPQPNISNKNLRNRLIYDIIGMIISIIILIGALMGGLVLRGTNSSGALAAFILLILLYEIYSFIKHYKEYNAFNDNVRTKLDNTPTHTNPNSKQNIKTPTDFPNKNNISTEYKEKQEPTKLNNTNTTPVQNIPTQNINQAPSPTNNSISDRIKNLDEKKKKIYIGLIVVVIIGICFGLLISGSSDETSYTADYSDSYGSVSLKITNVTESDETNTEYSWKYSYFVYGEISGSVPYNSYIDIEYYDTDNLLIKTNTNRGNFMDNTEISIDDYFGDTKVNKITARLYDSNNKLLGQDTYYIR